MLLRPMCEHVQSLELLYIYVLVFIRCQTYKSTVRREQRNMLSENIIMLIIIIMFYDAHIQCTVHTTKSRCVLEQFSIIVFLSSDTLWFCLM